jgi:hypothetical protein
MFLFYTLVLFVYLYTPLVVSSYVVCRIYWVCHYYERSQSQSYITTDSQSANPSLCQTPIWDPRPIFPFALCLFLDSCRLFYVGHPLWRDDGSVICSAMAQVQFEVILRPTVCRPVRLGAGPPMGPRDQILITLFDNYFLSSRCRALSPYPYEQGSDCFRFYTFTRGEGCCYLA